MLSKIDKQFFRNKSMKLLIGGSPSKIFHLEEFAKNLVPTIRSWSETVFRTALIDRKEKYIDEIVNKFYNSYQQEISENPEGHGMDYVHIIMEIKKI